jgi:uncharacterized protein YwgA
MNKKEVTAKDFLLALLYCPGRNDNINEPITGRTKLTKMVFLFEKEIKKPFFSDMEIALPSFDPYNFGPFSKELFDDLSFFLSIGFIRAEKTLIPISTAEKFEIEIGSDDDWINAVFDKPEQEPVELEYSLSQQGEKYVTDKVWPQFSDLQKQGLQQFKQQINTISLDSLLRYVYNKYPESAENSLIREKYVKKEY